jgi:hypothetical protein
MLKTSLITALLAFSGLVAQAQTPAASAAAPAKAASTAGGPAKTASAAVAATPAAKPAAKTAAAEPEVKKSNNGICHDKASKGYKSTKNFTEFKSMDECLKSGGRAPKK